MKIAISSTGSSLDSEVEYRFGRAPYFIIVDSETMEYEVYENPAMMAPGGAGIRAAQFVASKGAQVVITGEAGPNALPALQAAGIEVIMGIQGKVKDVVEDFKRGELKGSGTLKDWRMYRAWQYAPPIPPMSEELEIETLKMRGKELEEVLKQINKRIEELERGLKKEVK